jgi:hypothetical protein
MNSKLLQFLPMIFPVSGETAFLTGDIPLKHFQPKKLQHLPLINLLKLFA